MENSTGWIKLHRAIMDHPDWLSEPFTRAQAWVDLLLLANHKAGHIRKRGIAITVDRGQVGHSEQTLASRWQWSKGKVRRFIVELTRLSQVSRRISQKTVLKKTSVSSLIYIVNYEKYQMNGTEDGTEDGPKTVTEQECKNEKNNLYRQNALQILSYLNEKTGKRYRDTSLIEARLKDGGSVDDCRKIIDTKMQDPYFREENPKYLNPQTLFRKSHWDQYLNETPLQEVKKPSW